MNRTFQRLALREIAAHPWSGGLSIVGIALGVAAVLAIDIVNHSAERAFGEATHRVTGPATDTIVGGPAGLDERIYRVLRVELGLRDAVPFVEGIIRHQGERVRRLKLVGIDPLATDTRAAAPGVPLANALDLLRRTDSALVDAALASELALSLPAEIEVWAGVRRHTLKLIDVLPAPADTATGLPTLLTDIATAQSVLDRPGTLSGIAVSLPRAERDAGLAALNRRLPAGVSMIPNQARGQAMAELTRAFRVNLTALSLLALLVGAFLIYNSMLISVLSQYRRLGTLRCLGATRGQIFALVMGQALLLGTIGTLIGLALGWVLSHGLLRLVVRTINDLYFQLAVSDPQITTPVLVKSLFLGTAASVAAALAPAYEATRIVPERVLARSGQEQRFRSYARIGFRAGIGAAVLGIVVLAIPARSLGAGFAGLFLLVAGFALVAPRLIAGLVASLEYGAERTLGSAGRIAARGISASLSRAGPAVTALAVAVAAAIGVGVMIESFRDTVDVWLRNYLRADLYVADPHRSGSGIEPRLIDRVRDLPHVRSVSVGRWTRVESGTGPVRVFAVGLDAYAFASFQFKTRRDPDTWRRFTREDAVIISETFAYRHRLQPGDALTLKTANGDRAFRVLGVFYDYGSDSGVVTVFRDVYLRHWRDPTVTSFAIYLDTPAAVTGALSRLEAELTHTGLEARSNLELRRLSLEIFDRTFTVTGVLRWLLLIIAGVGVLGALTAIQLERQREFGVLRALGFTPRGITGVVTAETGLMGLVAGLLAIPLGTVLALALIWVINRRAFGWTMQISADIEPALTGLLLAVVAGVLAGLYPAVSLARTSLADALRHE